MNAQSELRPSNDIEEIDVIALVGVAWGYRYLIIATAVVCVLIATFLAMTATEIYRADVVVTPARESNMGGAGGSLASQLGGLASLAGVNIGSSGAAAQEAQAVLVSRRLAEEFVRRNEIVPLLLPAGSPRSTVWFAVKQFRERVISIETDKRTGATTVSVEWNDPKTAALWANGYVALANELIRTRAREDATRNIEYLNKQIAQTNVLEVQRVMYNLIETETKNLMLANARREYAFTIVDPATVPEQRVKPWRSLMVLTGGILGLLLGTALAFVHRAVRRHRSAASSNGVDARSKL
jgi:uncharacterized protein involved in exopolysaccharide biosynthesis